MEAAVTAGWVAEQGTYGSLQAAVPLDKERGLALLSGSLLMAALELALPVKVTVLQQMQEQGRTIRAHQREEPDDLQLARQQIEGLLQQIQPEPYKLYERWDILVMHERGNRRTGNVIHDLWRHLPEQTRLGPEWAGEPRRFTGLLQEARGLFIKLQQDRHHAAHSKADTTFHSISWHVAVLRLSEIPLELQSSARLILEMSTAMPASIRAGMEQVLVVLEGIDIRSLIAHVEHSFVQLAAGRTQLGEAWVTMHPGAEAGQEDSPQSDVLASMREELSILHDRFASLSGALGPVLNRLGEDMEAVSSQLRELMVSQAQMQKQVKGAHGASAVDSEAALQSVRVAYRQLQDLRNRIVDDITALDPGFRFYHCIIYRELIIQALRRQVVRFEQLVDLSRQTILQKTIRSSGDTGLAERMIQLQVERFGAQIQSILDRITYPEQPVDVHDLIPRDE
jgi:hypothetical protein